MIVCKWCGAGDPYIINRPFTAKCRECTRNFSYRPPEQRCTKMAPEKWEKLEQLWKLGWNALQASKETGVDYHTSWRCWKIFRQKARALNAAQ